MLKRIAALLLVNEGEYRQVIHFLLFFFLLGAGVALGRGTADALFFKRYGIEYLPVIYVVLGFLLASASTVYAAFVDRLPAERFFAILFYVLIGVLVLCWGAMGFSAFDSVYPVYFLIYEIVSEIFLVHAALYVSHNFETLQSKRLMPIIMAGAQIGMIIGNLVLAASAPLLGVQNVILLWVFVLTAGAIQLFWWHRREGVSRYFRPDRRGGSQLARSVEQVFQGVKLMHTSKLLRASSFALFFMVIVFYVLCFAVNRVYTMTFESEESLAAFFGILAATNGILAFLAQLFITNRLIMRFGVRRINMIFPVSSLFSYGVLLFTFSLPAALLGSFVKDAIMPAFRNPVRNLFFNALPTNIQGRARATSVVVVMPLALIVGGSLLWGAQGVDQAVYLLVPGAGAAVLYLIFSLWMNRAYVSELIHHLRGKLVLPNEQLLGGALRGSDSSAFKELVKGVEHEDPAISLSFARVLASSFPDWAAPPILARLRTADRALRDQLMNIVIPLRPPELGNRLREQWSDADPHLQATIARALFELGDEKAKVWAERMLNSEHPRLRAAAVVGTRQYRDRRLWEDGTAAWAGLLGSDERSERLAGLEVAQRLGWSAVDAAEVSAQVTTAVSRCLEETGDERGQQLALHVLAEWPPAAIPELSKQLLEIYRVTGFETRLACLQASRVLDAKERAAVLTEALEDSHPEVRRAAARGLDTGTSETTERFCQWIVDDNSGSPRAQQALIEQLLERGASKEHLWQIAQSKTEDAELLLRARVTLEATGEAAPPATVVRYTLDERVQQVVDLALTAMQGIEDSERVAVVRAGLKSQDDRHIANACEALRNLDHKQLGIRLSTIVEQFSSPDGSSSEGVGFRDLTEVVEWCRLRADPWMRACAEYALTPQTAS